MSLLGAAEIRELAESLNLKPSKSLGQNFVHDGNVCRKIVRTAGLTSTDIALEIGPGLGSPNINSYKRYVPGSFAPTAIAWGRDNRTCALRLVGHGGSLRLENRVPGGDVNPYLAVAGIIAAGLDGINRKLKLEDAFVGNAYASDSERVPSTMLEAQKLWSESAWVKSVFGAEVQAHYTNMAQVELDAYGKAVTDWELFRNFERF